ncbi:MAG: MBL fold metallo-hydrolase [Peptococcaceae bacterium]|nr:MBL fold metallo-hydrolase [Peptococcaceae bacterium]
MIKVEEHGGVTVFGGRVSMLGLGSLKIFVFLYRGSLIDAGPGRLHRELAPLLKPRQIERVLLTHFHEDHSGNAAWLQREKGVPVLVSPQALDLCGKDARLPLYRRFFWGKRPGFDPRPLGDAVECDGGRLKVIATPGHSHDHVCFLDSERGCLFTGDLFVTPRTRIIMRHESVPEIIGSIRRLLKEDFNTLYCAHAGVVENGHGMMAAKLRHLEELRERVLELHRRGMSAKEIDRKIFGKPQALERISSGEWSSRHIVTSIIREGIGD